MRIVLAQLAPVPGDVERNLARVQALVRAAPADLVVLPELYLSGYRVGDSFPRLALRPNDPAMERLRAIAREGRTTLVVGAPIAAEGRHGEIHNAAVAVPPTGETLVQVKRYLPTFGPFEEGTHFTPSDTSRPFPLAGHRIGLEICYDVFFPEVSRELALAGAELLVAISAAPITSRRLFERLLPARAIENAVPVVYVNRVGVEDGIVFGGGTGAWDARGEPREAAPVPGIDLAPEESVSAIEIDPGESSRWRPFRPVLRDVAARPGRSPRAAA